MRYSILLLYVVQLSWFTALDCSGDDKLLTVGMFVIFHRRISIVNNHRRKQPSLQANRLSFCPTYPRGT